MLFYQGETRVLQQSAVIIGAGVVGVASAYALAERGWQITLVDQGAGPATGASHSNGAQLSYCFTDALGSPSTFAALPSLLAGKGGVSIGLSARPGYLCWLARFARNCTAGRFRANTLAVLDLATRSRAAMDRLCEMHSLEFSHRVAGKVNLLYSPHDERRAAEIVAFKRDAGCEQELIDRSQLEQLDPALEGLDEAVIGAVSTPSEVVGDPLLFSRSLVDVLTSEYGMATRFDTGVRAIEERADTATITLGNGEQLNADMVVVAGGHSSNALLGPTGNAIGLQPIKGYSFEMPLANGSPQISVTDGKRRLVFTNLGDRMRVAGIAEVGNGSLDIDSARIDWLIASASESLPNAGDFSKAGKFWTGLRPSTPNSQPVIRRASKRIAINTGHGSLGWTLAMGSAEQLASLVES